MNHKKTIQYADDDYESIGTLLKLRAPALITGLLLGIGISFVTSRFEEVLMRNIQIAYFLPFIVYIADAIGHQTEAIYSRDLRSGRAGFSNYLRKELLLGIIFGLLFGIIAGGIAFLWLGNELLAATVGISTFAAITTAPVIAILITHAFQWMHEDPAAGSGPITTVIQDVTSILIYGIVASCIIL